MAAVAVAPTPPTDTRSFHSAETPYAIPNDEKEWERLDDMHFGLKAYLGGKNNMAPIENPKTILELGAGSGIWAVETAKQFPDAEVTAVDVSQINMKRKPDNCTFKVVNLSKEWPFPPESFDVIHARFLLVHIPHWQELAKKCIAALKPGGIMLFEDLDHWFHSESGPVPSEVSRLHDIYHAHMDPSGIDPHTGLKLEGFLKETGAFSEVHCLQFKPPMTEYTDDANLNHIGLVMRTSLIRAYGPLPAKMASSGMTPDIFEAWKKEICNPAHKIYVDLFWTWARKVEKSG